MSPDLADLVAAARAGDRSAFDELVRATYADMYTLAYRLTGNEEDARDVVQDAYLRAYGVCSGSAATPASARGCTGSRPTARPPIWPGGPGPATTTWTTSRRSPICRPEHDPQLQAAASYDRERVARAVAELPPRLRAVVVLRDVYDLPHEAIAAELGISEAAAKVRLHRARRKLRERLFPLRTEQQVSEGGDAHAV